MVTKHICANGVRIVAEDIPHVRSVAIGIWVNVGSRYEQPHENGMTHFIEHMLFKGTETRSAKDIAEAFDRIGGQLNAFTSKENTCYYGVVLDHHAKKAIEMLADMFFHSKFAPEDIDKERQVILEEIAMTEDVPDEDVDERLWQGMFPNNALGAPILGTAETLQTFNRENILAYMHKHYRPEQIVVSVAGHLSSSLIQMIEELFDQFPNTAKLKPTILTLPTFVPAKIEKTSHVEQSHLALGYPGLGMEAPNLLSLVVLNSVLGDSMSSRLFQEVREEKALAYSVYSYYSAYQDTGAFVIYAGTSPHQLPLLQQTIYQSIDTICRDGITEKELMFAKEQLESNLLLGLETSYDYMNRNAKNELVFGYNRTIEEALAELQEVTVQSVGQIITEHLKQPYASSIITPAKGSN
ncbi:insulinase family protein [Viridibacillus sp. YIM B01967]|uniref:Insulinase family protein n=1 Tax=Viridibacillus soli TaxID=2798301 RepID=A0ABS1H4V5_9BACL|nr:pitrilysin family protein [Viridibacillus soli]MBK3494339.1 insulinase family protein [Viridibacillus soli]